MGSSTRPPSVPRLKMHRPYTAKSVRRPPTAALGATTNLNGDDEVGVAMKHLRASFMALDRQSGTGIVPVDEVDVVLRTYNIDTTSQVIRQLMRRCSVQSGGVDFHRFTAGLGVKLGLQQSGPSQKGGSRRPTSAAVGRPTKPARFKFAGHDDTFQRVMPEGRTISQPATPWLPGKRVELENSPNPAATFSNVLPPHLKSVRKANLAAAAREREDGEQTPPSYQHGGKTASRYQNSPSNGKTGTINSFEWFQHIPSKSRPQTAKPAGGAWRVSPSQTLLQRRSNGWPEPKKTVSKTIIGTGGACLINPKFLAYGLRKAGLG